jgi:carboxypeptidase Q
MGRLVFLCIAAVTSLTAQDVTEQYRAIANRIIEAAKTDEDGWRKISYLCDRIGNRPSGSAALEQAIDWAIDTMHKDGLDNTRRIAAKVPHWERGQESVALVEPVARPLLMLGLGGSIATPPEGITAEVVPVSSFEEMEKLGREKIAGKIVLYNVPFAGYGRTVIYRTSGAVRAAKLGAVATLLRSVGPTSLQTPHTGTMDYEDGVTKIPAAALTIEGATMIQRLADAGNKVVVRLKMEAQTLPDADSGDAIGDLTGREKPKEIVVVGGHIDSWDVGSGAQDDGSGAMAALQAVALLKKMGLQPRRTIRVVLWTNEETKGRGAQAYRDWVGDKIGDHVAAIEMDGGAEHPRGFGFSAGVGLSPVVQAKALDRMKAIGKLLESIGAGEITAGGGGADIAPLMKDGVPGIGHRSVGTHYFEWHHTPADTLDKVDKQDFRLNIAALAVATYVIADMPERLVEK